MNDIFDSYPVSHDRDDGDSEVNALRKELRKAEKKLRKKQNKGSKSKKLKKKVKRLKKELKRTRRHQALPASQPRANDERSFLREVVSYALPRLIDHVLPPRQALPPPQRSPLPRPEVIYLPATVGGKDE